MSLQNRNLLLVFLTSLFFTLFAPVLFPSLRLAFFIPFLVILFYRKPLISCLWGAVGCGLILDLLSSQTRLGLYAINFTLTSGLLFQQRRHFFADSPSTLPIMTFLFSLISTLIQGVLLNIFEGPFQISGEWFLYDLGVMPLLDAAYAFTVFIVPYLLFGTPIRSGRDYFLAE